MSATHWIKKAKEGVALRQRDPFDFYPTNKEHVISGLNLITNEPKMILDPGMGTGIWGKYARYKWENSTITGVEIRTDAIFKDWYDFSIRGDFLGMPGVEPMFDCVIGNPPYGMAEEFVRRSLALMLPGAQMVFLLRLSFLASATRYRMHKFEYPLRKVVVCSDRPSFIESGKSDADDYAFFVWEKGYTGATETDYVLSKPASIDKYGGYQNLMFKDLA